MTQQPTNDLKARIEIARKNLMEVIGVLDADGRYKLAQETDESEHLLHDLSTLLSPSDSGVKEALEILRCKQQFCEAQIDIGADVDVEEGEQDIWEVEYKEYETIRAVILGLAALIAEKEREIAELMDIASKCLELAGHGDYKNGITDEHNTIDQGEVYAWAWYDEQKKRLDKYLSEEPHDD